MMEMLGEGCGTDDEAVEHNLRAFSGKDRLGAQAALGSEKFGATIRLPVDLITCSTKNVANPVITVIRNSGRKMNMDVHFNMPG